MPTVLLRDSISETLSNDYSLQARISSVIFLRAWKNTLKNKANEDLTE